MINLSAGNDQSFDDEIKMPKEQSPFKEDEYKVRYKSYTYIVKNASPLWLTKSMSTRW